MNSASDVNELFEQWKKQGKTKEELVVLTANAELGWPYVWGAVGAECTPDKRWYYAHRDVCPEGEKKQILKTCQYYNEDGTKTGKSCGGCTYYPDNMRTLCDDCQGFVKQVCSRVGITFAGGGATSMWDSAGNWSEKGVIANIPTNKVCCVFWRNGEKMSHVGFYIGGGIVIHCSGTVKREKLSSLRCTHYAIPRGLGGDTPMPTHATIRRGSTGADVVECQQDLLKLGYDLGSYGADGKFGAKTEAAVKQFQSTHTDPNTGDRLKVDGIVGPASWAALDAAVGPSPTPTTDRYTVTIPHLTLEQANALIAEYPAADKKKE